MWSFVVSFSEAVADTKARSTLPGAFQEHKFRIALEGVGLVGTAQQVLGHNPLEIFFLALDAVPRAPVRLGSYKHCFARQPRGLAVPGTGGGRRRRYRRCGPSCASIMSGDADMSRTAHCQLINHHESVGNDAAASFSACGLPRLRDFCARARHGFYGRSPRCPPEILAQCRSEERDWAGSFSKPIDLCDDGPPPSLESAASPAYFTARAILTSESEI
jgi:hypothetical protein